MRYRTYLYIAFGAGILAAVVAFFLMSNHVISLFTLRVVHISLLAVLVGFQARRLWCERQRKKMFKNWPKYEE